MRRPRPQTRHEADEANPYAAGYFNGFHNRNGGQIADRDGDPLDLDPDGTVAYDQGWDAGYLDYEVDAFYGEGADTRRLNGHT